MKRTLTILLLLVVLGAGKSAFAVKTTVNTLSGLTTAYANARAGDTIVVANGIYSWGKILLTNTANTITSNWIVVMAETVSGVTFKDSTYINFSGTRIRIDGFKFANGSCSTNAVVAFRSSSSVLANYCRVSNITFDNYNSIDTVQNEWVAIFGTNNRVDHCTFINKSNAKATVIIWYSTATFPDRSVSTYHRIDSNYFKGRSYMGGNGGETIRVGVGNNSRTFGYNTIEYNLFEGCTQTEPEIVSNKSYYNTYRYNTFKNCNGGLTLRMGKYCTVYGNFFINDDPAKTESYGIRIIDKGHKVYNNYCEGLLGASGSLTSIRCPIITYNGTYSSADSLNPLILNGAYLPADSALILNNTIVNCAGGAGVKLGNYDAGLALNQPLGATVANNVIKMTSGQAVYIEPTNTSMTYFAEGNMFNAPAGLGISNTTGFANTTLTFGTRVNGILSAPSAVQDAAVNTPTYNTIIGNLDAQGQTRSIVFDAGCDEINGVGNVVNYPLDTNLVGAGKPSIVPQNQTITFNAIPLKYVNSADFNPGATASSGLALTYNSSNTAVATIVNGNIHIVGAGTSNITASQSGNIYFNAAPSVTQVLTVSKLSQTITFAAISNKVVNNADFNPGATTSSGLAVSYTSSNTAVATIVNNNVHLVGYGTCVITASQAGNATYDAAANVSQNLTVTGLSQTISFPALSVKSTGDADFAPGATASSGLAVAYTSSNTNVATIVNNSIHLVGAGTAVITASQTGNNIYYAATSVNQNLTVVNTFTYVPSSTTITSGSLNSGAYGNLSTNNASYYIVNSTTSSTRKIDWYGAVTITQPPASVTKLTITYDGKNSASKTQVLYLYNWVTAAWVQIDSRTVSTTDVTVTNTQTSPANYISTTGQIRLRVYSTGGTSNYSCSGDWMQFQIQSTSVAKGIAVSTGEEIIDKPVVNTSLIYPNPASSQAILKYVLSENSNVSISVYNTEGKMLKKIKNNNLQRKGFYQEMISCDELPNGIYLLRIIKNHQMETLKWVINKN